MHCGSDSMWATFSLYQLSWHYYTDGSGMRPVSWVEISRYVAAGNRGKNHSSLSGEHWNLHRSLLKLNTLLYS
jgi:hypothetical protein